MLFPWWMDERAVCALRFIRFPSGAIVDRAGFASGHRGGSAARRMRGILPLKLDLPKI
jgi:hypothetical protein